MEFARHMASIRTQKNPKMLESGDPNLTKMKISGKIGFRKGQ